MNKIFNLTCQFVILFYDFIVTLCQFVFSLCEFIIILGGVFFFIYIICHYHRYMF